MEYLWLLKIIGEKLLYPFSHYIDIAIITLLALFAVAFIIQLIYYYGFFIRVSTYKRAPQLKKYPISVIICARNEAENLEANLPAVLEQKHENFEVIVVNDCSTDSTDDVLGELLKKYKHLRTTTITPDKKFTHGKKLAVTVGIKASKHEWLVFTDADCHPVSENWLERLQENFTDRTDIVLGYGGYLTAKGLLNKYIRFDTLFIAVQYFSYAMMGKTYMGVGRNLAYRKSLFFKNKGFASHYGLISGDDDLFINETATDSNTATEFHLESHTRSIPKMTWSAWFTQKKRHFTTSRHYRPIHIFLLGLEPWSRLLFYITFCYLLVLKIFIPYILAAFFVRLISVLLISKMAMKKFNEHKILLWIPVFDLFALFINFNIFILSIFRSKKSRWK